MEKQNKGMGRRSFIQRVGLGIAGVVGAGRAVAKYEPVSTVPVVDEYDSRMVYTCAVPRDCGYWLVRFRAKVNDLDAERVRVGGIGGQVLSVARETDVVLPGRLLKQADLSAYNSAFHKRRRENQARAISGGWRRPYVVIRKGSPAEYDAQFIAGRDSAITFSPG